MLHKKAYLFHDNQPWHTSIITCHRVHKKHAFQVESMMIRSARSCVNAYSHKAAQPLPTPTTRRRRPPPRLRHARDQGMYCHLTHSIHALEGKPEPSALRRLPVLQLNYNQAYAAERDDPDNSALSIMGYTPAGYFSTCCMPDDRLGFPPGSDGDADGVHRCTGSQAGFCVETDVNRPRNDYYDPTMCSADSFAGVPTIADATIATEK